MNVNSINPVRENPKRPDPVAEIGNKETTGKSQEIAGSRQADIVSGHELVDAVENANELGQLLKRKLSFAVDEATDKVIVKVIDEESGEVVRQVPPQEMLRIAAHLKKLKDMNDQVMSAVKSVILDVKC